MAENLPGDEAPYYTSPWAGANFLPMGFDGSPSQQYEIDTAPFLWRLSDDVPEAGVHLTRAYMLAERLMHI